MKKILKIIVVVFIVVFIALQFVRPDRTTPPIIAAETIEATTQIPENVALILTRSCNDCHTNQTVYPWYSNISPFSWLLAGHIEEGRGKLNFSIWNTYQATKKRRKLSQICEQVMNGEMPHHQYLWLHRDAQLSAADKKLLCDWADAEKAKTAEL